MDRARYSRQILFPNIGEEGQLRLLQSRVAIVGMGALGTVLANHMVRAGAGFVRLIDRDFVEWSNLQRQMLYDENDAKQLLPKAEAAAGKLRQINSSVVIEPIVADLTSQNAEQWLADVDLILDGTDNFQIRFLINDVSVKHQIPWVYGGAVSAHGMTFAIIPGRTPCLRCMFASAPAPGTTPTCDTAGVIGPIIHVIASLQATEAIKYLTGHADAVSRVSTSVDVWNTQFRQIDLTHAKQPSCICCGQHTFEYLQTSIQEQTTTLCGRDTVQVHPKEEVRIPLADFAKRMEPIGKVEANRFLVRVHIKDYVLVVFPDGRALVQGTNEPGIARSLYAKYIGM
ncbi:ThiF family adenylyltransferase [Fodinisporobacter ferrooxydans]|uniref:ThiF family adenylyltransferase n=1 Tax=Fodinisporobacter ferrooxydans TaxID=2901836 RepID=A0ABY4CR43_9BACL|nr:ThiF family adenylyltransferase [Alicyclobacillaceae bacterium MYW30-H2]